MAASLGGVGGDLPRTRVPERDPWGIRAVAALLLVTAFAFSFGPFGGSLRDGFKAHGWMETVPPRTDAWVTPPAYTGKAPVFLTSNSNAPASAQPASQSADQAVRPPPSAFTVPENSELSLRVTGGSGEETLAFTDAAGNTRTSRRRARRPDRITKPQTLSRLQRPPPRRACASLRAS